MYNNPYFQQQTMRQNVLPPQQIPQANGKASIDMLVMSPNSSILIADSTEPIVWKCVSDSLGNVTAQAFDISPHKTEEEVKQDSIQEMNNRLKKLEADYESIISRIAEQSHIKSSSNGSEYPKSAGTVTEYNE